LGFDINYYIFETNPSMLKKILFAISVSLFGIYGAFSQGGTWEWVNGANTANPAAVYGTQGVAAPGNHPSALYNAASWQDANGNFWIFGGVNTNI
jgi:hypothetical protein